MISKMNEALSISEMDDFTWICIWVSLQVFCDFNFFLLQFMLPACIHINNQPALERNDGPIVSYNFVFQKLRFYWTWSFIQAWVVVDESVSWIHILPLLEGFDIVIWFLQIIVFAFLGFSAMPNPGVSDPSAGSTITFFMYLVL